MTTMTGGRAGSVRPFTPSRESGAVLDARTVGRDRLLEVMAARFASAARTQNRIHTLLVGPRGSGKSHLVEVALHRLAQDVTLRERLAVVTVPEDVFGLTRFSDIVSLVTQELAGRPAIAQRDAGHWSQVSDLLAGRVLVLVVENLDRLFDALGEAGQRDLRSWVETSGEVVLLATTPLLTAAVTSRERPWFGGFAVEEVASLTAPEGGELLLRIARERGDDRLADFLQTPTGQARLRSVAQLTGGSPRVWMILADCVSAQSLDDLVPAVQDLLEGLVPYYQQLLWDLAANEQRIVRALAEGPYGALTVGEIAASAGLEERTAATSLGRLKASRWVTSEKPGVGDARRVLYSLREPMLRHHVQYRSGDRATLLLIVELLRGWFDRSERVARLAAVPAGSATMMHLAHSNAQAGRLHEAIIAYETTLTDQQRLLGPDHPDTLWTRLGLADALRGAGELTRAIDLMTSTGAELAGMPHLQRHREYARWLLEACVTDLVDAGDGVGDGGVAHLFGRAFRGEAEALVRLPTELRDLVEQHLSAEPGSG